ncbi:hypothetical protein JKY72_01940 [Candidatus Gracilibacteria bacterium]|nr:hypothetical protein [Candidatus Gracilibacteria bacterium]
MEKFDGLPIHEVPKDEVFVVIDDITVGTDTMVRAGKSFVSVDRRTLPVLRRLFLDAVAEKMDVTYIVLHMRNLVTCTLMEDGSVEGSGWVEHSDECLGMDGVRHHLAPSLVSGEKAHSVAMKAGDLPENYSLVLTANYQIVGRAGAIRLYPLDEDSVPAPASSGDVMAMMFDSSSILRKGAQIVVRKKGGAVEIEIWPSVDSSGKRISEIIIVSPDTVLNVFIPMDQAPALVLGSWN